MPVLIAPGALIAAAPAGAAEQGVDGPALSPWWVLPFAGMLLSIAIVLLISPHCWHRFQGLVMLGWALACVVPAALLFGAEPISDMVLHTGLLENIPLLIRMFALFTMAGGVHLAGTLRGTLGTNTVLRAFDFAVKSLTGETGALTPLGDPPLFLGFLKGVQSFWPTQSLFAPTLLLAALLLLIYQQIESRYFRSEPAAIRVTPDGGEPLRIRGRGEHPAAADGGAGGADGGRVAPRRGDVPEAWHRHRAGGRRHTAARDRRLLDLGDARAGAQRQRLHLGAAIEVAKAFAAIFVPIVPAIAVLRAGREGALTELMALTSDASGNADPTMHAWR